MADNPADFQSIFVDGDPKKGLRPNSSLITALRAVYGGVVATLAIDTPDPSFIATHLANVDFFLRRGRTNIRLQKKSFAKKDIRDALSTSTDPDDQIVTVYVDFTGFAQPHIKVRDFSLLTYNGSTAAPSSTTSSPR